MKITVICKSAEWQTEKLRVAATALGVDFEVRDIALSENFPKNLGEVVLWRSSSLGSSSARFEMMNAIQKNHLLINRCLAIIPQATEKAFQQKYIQKKTNSVKCIPTYTFCTIQEIEVALQKGILRYPFIQKPNKGSKGKGVEFVQNKEDLNRVAKNIDRQVYQNFIPNSGDYRAFMLGGRMLGAIKRTAKEGGILNNISQGGSAIIVTDKKILTKLRRISTTVASAFELALCGVDIIFDEATQEYFFLEVNTVPQWKGFQEATGIDVAKEIIHYCKRMVGRNARPLFAVVSEEYQSQIHFLGDKKFHFLSRLHLWGNNGNAFKKDLADLRATYIGLSEKDYRKRLQEIFTHIPLHGDRMASKESRQLYFKKYPRLEPFLNLLFKNLFARELYGIDLHEYIRELVSDVEFLHLKNALENDDEAMRILSTHAINYLYMLDDYLGTKESAVDPKKYFRIGTAYSKKSFELQIYFLTHCIIGASKFYSTPIKKGFVPIYVQMLECIEEIIHDNFQTISLDNKFEFLVCAKICNYISTIEKNVLLEAGRSFAPDGNFLIDTYNAKAAPDERNDFVGSEHRNVLFIMSQTPFHPLSNK